MQLDILKYDFKNNEIRTVTHDDGSVWFVAKDITDSLGMSNGREAVRKLDDDEKNAVILNDGSGKPNNFTILNESGMYSLILQSRKPEAKDFKKWVTNEVLPSIRKTGSYSMIPENQPSLPTNYIEALQALIESEKAKQIALENQAKAEAEVSKLTTIIDNEFGWSSILRAASYAGVHESTFKWRTLKSVTIGLGLEVKRVPSPRFDYQVLYPIKAFQIAYPDIDFDDLTPEAHDDKLELALL